MSKLIRLRVLPRVPPLELELQNTGSVVQWRLGTTGDWTDLINISDIDATIAVGTVTTLPPGESATVVNVGTDSAAVLNFALPAGNDGEDGLGTVQAVVAGTGIDVDATDPTNPIISVEAGLYQPLDASLTAYAVLTTAADKAVYYSAADTPVTYDLTSFARTLLDDATAAAFLTTLGVSAFVQTLLDDAAATNFRTTLGIGTGDSPQFTGVNVGHASDTPVTRAAAGVIAVGGVPVYSNIPQNSQSAAYTLVLADAQKHVYHPTTDDNARTFTIPANASVAYPIGTAITFINDQNTVTIAITSDTLVLAGTGSTGSRTLAENGMATAVKVTSTRWVISGAGLT